ncbi:Uncharacterised protein [Vibrio cholerae]|nr:Uncharacterised protein [Vibrio cholerae]
MNRVLTQSELAIHAILNAIPLKFEHIIRLKHGGMIDG